MKLKHSLVYSSSSGPIHGGLVSSGANGSTLCIRTRKRVGMSNKQSQRRSSFLSIAQAWRTLLPVVKLNYANAAVLVSRQNHFNGARVFTGFQLFFYVQSMRLIQNSNLFTGWPFLGLPMSMQPLSFVWDVSRSSVLFNFINSGLSNHRLMLFASPALNVTSSFSFKDYRYILTIYYTSANPFYLRTYYDRVFSAGFVSGTYVSFKVVPFSTSGVPYYTPQFFQCLIP